MVQRILVMFGVTRPEVVVVVPSQEGIHAEEEAVQPPRPEDGIMDQFVKAVDQEMPEVAVDEHQEQRNVPRPVEGGVDGGAGAQGQDGEIAQGLYESQEIAAFVEFRELFPRHTAPVPLHARLRGRRVVLRSLGQHFLVGKHGMIRTDYFGGFTRSAGFSGRFAHDSIPPATC